jgi:uncharacterized protein
VILYADSSGLVKRYVLEQYSTEVNDLIAQADETITAPISRVECVAAIYRHVREGRLDAAGAAMAVAEMNADWPDLREVVMDDSLIQDACDLAARYPLKGYDAVQLAAAVRAQSLAGEPITVLVIDRQLGTACRAEGLTTWPPRTAITGERDSSAAPPSPPSPGAS